jgi:hypothetical protein
MGDMMKILIAYDGEKGADSLLNDLRLAGLPSQVEAVVLRFPLILCHCRPASVASTRPGCRSNSIQNGL